MITFLSDLPPEALCEVEIAADVARVGKHLFDRVDDCFLEVAHEDLIG